MRFREKAEKHIFFFGREIVREQLCTRKEMRRGRKSENKKQPQVAKKRKRKRKKRGSNYEKVRLERKVLTGKILIFHKPYLQ